MTSGSTLSFSCSVYFVYQFPNVTPELGYQTRPTDTVKRVIAFGFP